MRSRVNDPLVLLGKVFVGLLESFRDFHEVILGTQITVIHLHEHWEGGLIFSNTISKLVREARVIHPVPSIKANSATKRTMYQCTCESVLRDLGHHTTVLQKHHAAAIPRTDVKGLTNIDDEYSRHTVL